MSKVDASSLVLFILPPIALLCWSIQQQRRKRKELFRQPHNDSSQQVLPSTLGSCETIRPPLPFIIQKLLSDCRLAYLATVDVDQGKHSSHLSLMRFTYLKKEDVIILTTNKQTKKFDILKKLCSVALLVHDFGEQGGSSSGVPSLGYSITLNGECNIEMGEEAERYRAAHLKHNPDYPQFIVGDDIAVLCVRVTSASVCNIHDQVQHWSLHDSIINSSS